VAVLGSIATADFFGESLDEDVRDLLVRAAGRRAPTVATGAREITDTAFRRSFEAVNLSVVPSDPDQLVRLTIGGDAVSESVRDLLRQAPSQGTCRVYMGYDGSGKSHHLSLVRAIALREGWVTASLKLDPKAVDPAKPATIYRELLAELNFPHVRTGHGTRTSSIS
jgi:hypothetical protein